MSIIWDKILQQWKVLQSKGCGSCGKFVGKYRSLWWSWDRIPIKFEDIFLVFLVESIPLVVG